MQSAKKHGKQSSIVIVAEGEELGSTIEIARKVKERFDYYDIRITVLGHVQRGGSPTCSDRVLGGRLGVRAVEALIEGESLKMVGVINGEIKLTLFSDAVSKAPPFNSDLIRIADIISK